MPMKIWPKYGTETVQEVPVFSFTHDQVELLLKQLAPREGTSKEIIAARLVACARRYLWLRKQYQAKPTQAEETYDAQGAASNAWLICDFKGSSEVSPGFWETAGA